MKYKVIKDKIVYFEDVFSDSKSWVDYIESHERNWEPWEKLTSDGGKSFMKRYGYKKIISGQHTEDPKLLELMNALNECTNIYKYLYDVKLEHGSNKDIFVFTKYDPGYPIYPLVDLQEHIDIPDDSEEYSYVIYFNDDYDGGELEFSKLDLKFKPTACSIVIFPSGDPFYHIAHKSKNGAKYFISHFWKAGAGAGYDGKY